MRAMVIQGADRPGPFLACPYSMNARRLSLLVITAALLFEALPWGVAQAAPAPPVAVDVWIRKAGSYGAGGLVERQEPRSIRLDTLVQQQVRHVDVQYETPMSYRGVQLAVILAAYKPPAGVDLALLRFRNGMIVPLPFRDARAMGRLDPFVALSMTAGPSGEAAPPPGKFPPINRRVEGYADIRQVTFLGNKLAVNDRWHPDVPDRVTGLFSPWMMVDSLEGIELVNGRAYYQQFNLDPAARPGFELFRQSCQFCHGVRKVGARFGWDYVEPIELYTHRKDGRRLFYHVRYRAEGAGRGQLMPALRHVTEDEAAQLWEWMKAVATRAMPAYAP
jgi:mono/diheme cytochrome c family protein